MENAETVVEKRRKCRTFKIGSYDNIALTVAVEKDEDNDYDDDRF